MMRIRARRVWLLLLLSIAGCGPSTVEQRDEPTRAADTATPGAPSATPLAPSPTPVPTSTVPPTSLPATATAEPPSTPTAEPPSPTAEPPSPTPVSATPTMPALTEYRHPAGSWVVQYPADLLKVEELNQDVTLFISTDRSTVAAVDTYVAEGNAYGNTGEDLRNRARDTLERIYGMPVSETDILADPEGSWATGITFTTDGGSKGEVVYMQPGFQQGDRRVYGFIYGYKAADEATILPRLQAIRTSFLSIPQPAGPPALLYVQDGAIMEQRGSEPAQRIAALPDVGQVLAAASLGDTVLVLGERGLYRVLLGDGSSVRLEITNSPLRFGQIIVSPGNDRAIVAASVDDADARFGFRMYLGLYDQVGDAFSVLPGTPDLEQYTALQPLGFTADGTGIYVLPQGQDPSFERVVVLDVETAEIMQDLAISGEGSVALSPDARAIVTLDRAPGGSSSFVTKFYDLPAQPPESRTVPLPGSLGGISSLLWSPDSQAVYLLDGSQSAEPAATYPLWRLDVASGESRQIAVLDRTDLLVAVSSNGQWILARSSTGDTGALLDVKARASMGITVAPEAFVAGLR